MRLSQSIRNIAAFAATVVAATALGQNAPKAAAPDAAWARFYAGTQKDIKWDPHFIPMLRKALPQHQWFWRDHYKFTPLPELVQLYIGVPGSVLLDESRYITADGCVPHDRTDHGMVWIDTVSQPAKVVFIASQPVRIADAQKPANHLLVFSSFTLDFQHLPPLLVQSIQRWIRAGSSSERKDLDYLDSRYNLSMVTLVQPTGEMLDFSPDILHIEAKDPGAKP